VGIILRRPVTLMLAVLIGVAAAMLAAGVPARAATDIGKIADQLRASHVYVDPAASSKLTAGQARDLARRIHDSGAPVYVAVLPDDPAYGGQRIFDRLRSAVGRPGVYAVALGSRFGAASDASVLPPRTAQSIAARNQREHPGDPAAILNGFVADVAAVTAGQGPGSGDGSPAARGSPGAGTWVVLLAVLALVAGGGLYLVRRSDRRRRERERAELEQVRGAVEEDITAYGEELGRIGFSPSDPAATPAMLEDYGRALDAYETAKDKSAAARRPEDVRAVTEALGEGRFALATLDARRHGRPLPERRPPCFFDPRHGPSVRDVDWAPQGGTPRPVPVCAADAARIDDGLDPAVRTVPVGGDRRPYWEAGPAYGPWAGGYFGGYGSMLLPGLLIGTVLGGATAPGPYPSGDAGDFSGGFDGSGDGGDFGGGFDGSGDGGDFGGGSGGDGGF
jgi:hypothetical protein